MTFEDGYNLLFAGPVDDWLKKNPLEKIVMRQLAGGPEKAARLMSMEELKESVVEAAVQVKTAPVHLARGYAAILSSYAAELSARLEIR